MKRLALLALVLAACGKGKELCLGDFVCVQSADRTGELCEPSCEADGGGCPQGTVCVKMEACCIGTGCLAALRSVCCPASGC